MPYVSENKEVSAFIDAIPDLIRSGSAIEIDMAKNYLNRQFQEEIDQCINRWSRLPSQLVEIKHFEPLSTQARSLYIHGYFVASIALCGMAVEALCISIATERVQEGVQRKTLVDPSIDVRKKILQLKKHFRADKTTSLLHQVLDIRKDCLHLHKKVTSRIALECISKLHLAVLGEFGLIPDSQGKVRYSTKKDVEETARLLESYMRKTEET